MSVSFTLSFATNSLSNYARALKITRDCNVIMSRFNKFTLANGDGLLDLCAVNEQVEDISKWTHIYTCLMERPSVYTSEKL